MTNGMLNATSAEITIPNAAPQRTPVATAHLDLPVSTYFDAARAANSIKTVAGKCGLASWARLTTTGIIAKHIAPARGTTTLQPVSRRIRKNTAAAPRMPNTGGIKAGHDIKPAEGFGVVEIERLVRTATQIDVSDERGGFEQCADGINPQSAILIKPRIALVLP